MSAVFGSMREGDVPELCRILSHAFAGPREGVEQWLASGGHGNLRVMCEGDAPPSACMLRIPMGQYFGGRSVALSGVAGVAVPPEARGKGLALAMMRAAMREMHAEGVPLSGLYCSTQALYRQVGYEQAGMRFVTKLPISRIAVKEKARRVRALEEKDEAAIRECYAAFASLYNGMLDRGAYIWNRVRTFRDAAYHPFGFFGEDGRLEGYLYMTQVRDANTGRHDIQLSDAVFTTPGAGRQLLAFLADFEPMANEVQFFGSPLHPLLTLLPQQRYRIELKDFWMLRLTNVRAALAARGYAPGVDAKMTFDVTDETIPEQSGPWTLRVANGRAGVERDGRAGSNPTIRCGVGGLASMYAGLYTPRQAAGVGLCEGTPEALAAAECLFGGGTPWMSDFY